MSQGSGAGLIAHNSPPSSQGAVPPAEAAAPAASLSVQWVIRWGWSPTVGTPGLSSSGPLSSLWKPPALHTSRHWHTQVSVRLGSSFNQPPTTHQKQWFCLKQVLGAGQHHAVRDSCSDVPATPPLSGLSWNSVMFTPASVSLCAHTGLFLS